jgi:hypothetical protein
MWVCGAKRKNCLIFAHPHNHICGYVEMHISTNVGHLSVLGFLLFIS